MARADERSKALAKLLGASLLSRRHGLHMSRTDLAERSGLGVETVARFERGENLPSLPRLLMLADALRCSVSELLQASSPRPLDQLLNGLVDLESLSDEDQALVINVLKTLVKELQLR